MTYRTSVRLVVTFANPPTVKTSHPYQPFSWRIELIPGVFVGAAVVLRPGGVWKLTRYCRSTEQTSLHSSAMTTAVVDAGSGSFSSPSTCSHHIVDTIVAHHSHDTSAQNRRGIIITSHHIMSSPHLNGHRSHPVIITPTSHYIARWYDIIVSPAPWA